MKTIEQAAQEYADDHYGKNYITENKTHDENAFKAGVEFAQRWISVKDELPPIDKLVQVKIQEIDSDKVYYDHDKIMPQEPFNMFECEQSMVTVTHWRPIELE